MQNYQNHTVNLSNCDTEPIHLIGQIQPHGFMVVMDSNTFRVEQVSQNLGNFILGLEPELLIGALPDALCNLGEYPVLEAQLQASTVLNPQLLTLKGKQFFGFLHESAGKLVLECEPYEQTTDQKRFERTFNFEEFQTALNNLEPLDQLAQILVSYVQRLLDYDRVMMYVFDEDWHGEVIAEKVKPGVKSYLHHHFPSTDIPEPARALLQKKHVRQIPDIKAQAVKIVPYLNPVTGEPSNIILSELRNPSEIHLEYLHNMEAFATLSVSILVKGKLWGIIACQHRQPKFINYWLRQNCNVAAKSFANAVLASQEMRDVTELDQYKKIEEALINQMIETESIEKGLFKGQYSLLDITTCSGAAIFTNNNLSTVGIVPEQEQIMQLVNWLSKHNNERIFYTRELAKQYPAATDFQTIASGLLALEISKYNKEYILYFKPEIRESIVWAGRPDKPELDETDTKLIPRKSFETWVEIVKGKSLAWTLNELEVAQLLLKDVIALILRNQTNQLKQLNKDLLESSDDLRRKNERLEDFAYIITHNLRSPMSNIKGLYNLYEAEPNQETGEEVMQHMNRVIDNMAATIDDLNMILQTTLDQQLTQVEVQIAELIDKEKQNLEAAIKGKGARIFTELEVPQVRMSKVYMESLLHNLLSNAIKYSSPERPPQVHIRTWCQGGSFCLSVSDNGLGLDMKRFGEKIFGLYKTFHENKDAKGLGLYMTRMQIEALGGTIEVESQPDRGTTFTVRFAAQT
ncbi:ATP-binding protein [Pontibacter sp. 13R65]|uniref:ATP-binding protein n=1 Tax=Pontibacter sp. 13R65 TaxID=3127458 RepID=UPI00301BEA55